MFCLETCEELLILGCYHCPIRLGRDATLVPNGIPAAQHQYARTLARAVEPYPRCTGPRRRDERDLCVFRDAEAVGAHDLAFATAPTMTTYGGGCGER